jgi:hypothetical protein
MAEPTLYERLGGIFAIAAVVDNFSDQPRPARGDTTRTSGPNRMRTVTPRRVRKS